MKYFSRSHLNFLTEVLFLFIFQSRPCHRLRRDNLYLLHLFLPPAVLSQSLNPPILKCCLSILVSSPNFIALLFLSLFHATGRGSSIGSEFVWHASGPEFDPHVRHILSWRLGHENISTAILPLPLIQEEQLSVTGERMCTKYW